MPGGGQVHLLSALDTSTGIVLAQVTVDAKSQRDPGVRAAARRRRDRAGHPDRRAVRRRRPAHPDRPRREIAARGAHLIIQVKANQPTLFAQLKALPWAQVPVGDRTRDRGHGRRETRTVKAVTLHTPGGIGFPHAEQAVRITRTRTVGGKTSRETAYLTVSLPADQAQPADLQDWARREWHIENRLHHVRDVTFREDLHQARTGTGPAVIATLRNTAIGYHRTNGETNIARATRRANRRPHDLITAVTSNYPTTQ